MITGYSRVVLNDDEIIKQKILKARLNQGVEKFNKHIKMYYFNNVTSEQSIYKYLDRIYHQEDKSFKILISFGYVTENTATETVRLFSPTQQYFFDHPIVIKNSQDINMLKHQIDRESIVHKISQRFPDSQTRLLGVYAMGVKVIRLDFPIGAKITLPHYIKVSKFINGLEDLDNNLCFWGCMAMAHGCRKDRYITKTKELFNDFYRGKKDFNNYTGFDYVNELDKYELVCPKHAINIISYDEDESIVYVRKSTFNAARTQIYLNLYLDHFSYVKDLKKLAKLYSCARCSHKFKDNDHLLTHLETCTLEQKDTFNKFSKIWQKKRNVIVELADYFEVEQDFKYDYLITFDLESVLTKINEFKSEENKVEVCH